MTVPRLLSSLGHRPLGRERARGRSIAPAPRVALVLALVAPLAGCIVARGGPEPLDAGVAASAGLDTGASLDTGTVGTLAGASLDPVSAAAHRALIRDEEGWQEAGSGAWGTVRRAGPDDERACTPAELTVHDYRGARVERRTLCPPPIGPVMPAP